MKVSRKKILAGCLSLIIDAAIAISSFAGISVYAAQRSNYINLDTTNILNIKLSSETDYKNLFPAFMAEKIKVTGDTIEKADDEDEEDIAAEPEEAENVPETETAPETEAVEETAAAPADSEEPEPETAAAVDLRSSVVSFALQFVGCPYVYGGTSLSGGCDCSGFTMGVYSNFGISLPHLSSSQTGCGTAVSLDSIQPGDLVFYGDGGGIYHVAIYIGGGQIVHAIDESKGIGISSLYCLTPVYAVSVL